MFTRKKIKFLSLILMSFTLVFTSACKKAEVYDLNTNDNEGLVQDSLQSEDVIEEQGIKEVVEEVSTKKEIVTKKEKEIIFDDLEWKKYNNDFLGYSIDYPTIVSVMGDDLDQYVEFVGPLSNNEWWPKISISHYNNNFYHPDEGVGVIDWVKVSPEYKLGEELSIAGLETVHYIQAKTPQAFAADYYYFIKDNQLYNIIITHTNDKQDWKIYNKILNSFVFIDSKTIKQ